MMPTPVLWVIAGLITVIGVLLFDLLTEEPPPLPPCSQICIEESYTF
jgi:hypothetical protein